VLALLQDLRWLYLVVLHASPAYFAYLRHLPSLNGVHPECGDGRHFTYFDGLERPAVSLEVDIQVSRSSGLDNGLRVLHPLLQLS